MDVLYLDDSIWAMQHHHSLVRRLHGLSRGTAHIGWVEGIPRV